MMAIAIVAAYQKRRFHMVFMREPSLRHAPVVCGAFAEALAARPAGGRRPSRGRRSGAARGIPGLAPLAAFRFPSFALPSASDRVAGIVLVTLEESNRVARKESLETR